VYNPKLDNIIPANEEKNNAKIKVEDILIIGSFFSNANISSSIFPGIKKIKQLTTTIIISII